MKRNKKINQKNFGHFIKKGLIFFLSFLSCALFSYFFYMKFLFMYGVYTFSHILSFGNTDYSAIVCIAISTIVLFVICWSILNKRFSILSKIILVGIYALILFTVLFLKNIGVRGFSMMPLDFFTQLNGDGTFVVVMNLLMFLPLGLIVRPSKRNVIFVFFGIVLVEVVQYSFSLGIFDIDDILLNMLGYCLGAYLDTTNVLKKVKQRYFEASH